MLDGGSGRVLVRVCLSGRPGCVLERVCTNGDLYVLVTGWVLERAFAFVGARVS